MIRIGEKEIPWREGITIADVLEEAADAYPYPVVRVNEKAVSRRDFERTTVPDGAELFPIAMIAGG
ncbi:MAG: MoaD/ThiS family protein [Myxococcota bacterium]